MNPVVTSDGGPKKKPKLNISELPKSSSSGDAAPPPATVKAYKNMEFLNSRPARPIRILCEFEETRTRLKAHNIEGTILIFGSARAHSPEHHQTLIKETTEALQSTSISPAEKSALEQKLSKLKQTEWMCEYYTKAQQLGRKITEWAMSPSVRMTSRWIRPPATTSYVTDEKKVLPPREFPQKFVVCTGGGPGMMEAANRGASEVPGAKTMGMNISLPFEQGLNPYVTPSLSFEFHYFFTRKFWMVYQAKAIVMFPGGFGTFDEMFETCTLKQTGKLHGHVPIVLVGKSYWEKVVNWRHMAELGVITHADVDALFITDSVDEAYDYVTRHLSAENELAPGSPPVSFNPLATPCSLDGASVSLPPALAPPPNGAAQTAQSP